MNVLELPPPGQIHLWSLGLNVSDGEARALHALLGADEHARAGRLADPLLRRRFVAGRGQLRSLLAGYVGQPAHSLVFTYNAHGRPSLDDGRIRFNLTHAAGRAVCAVACDIDVGVDLERVRVLPELDALVRQVMSPLERMLFDELPVSERMVAFHRCWTRKEACLKAQGVGIVRDLRQLSVSLVAEQAPRLLQLDGATAEADAWQLRAWEQDGMWVGAVAADTGGQPVDILWQRAGPIDGQSLPPATSSFSIPLQQPASSVPGPERAQAHANQ